MQHELRNLPCQCVNVAEECNRGDIWKPWDSTWACSVVVVTPEAGHRNKTLASLKSGKHQRCLSNHTSSSKTTRGLPLNFSIDPAGCNSLTSPSPGLKPRG